MGKAMTDHAKWLAEFEAHHAAIEARARGDMDPGDGMRAHEDRGALLDMIRAASDALDDAGVTAEVGSLVERIAFLRRDADGIGDCAERQWNEVSAALTAAGVPDDGRRLAERVRALAARENKTHKRACDHSGAAFDARWPTLGAALDAGDLAAFNKQMAALEQASHKAAQQDRARLDADPRCRLSGNPCGTDTWAVGRPCPCEPCQQWLRRQRADAIDRRHGVDPESERRLEVFLAATEPATSATASRWQRRPSRASLRRIAVLDPAEHASGGGAARMREYLNSEFGLSTTVADLARALRISQEDMLAIESGTKTTDAAGRAEIQTALFLLGSGKEPEHIADPESDPSFWEALDAQDGETDPPADLVQRCDVCGRESPLGLEHDYHPEPDIEPAVGDEPGAPS